MSRDDCDVCDEEFAKLRGQIATLKAICVKERDRQIGCERETIEQLAQEYPEIFGVSILVFLELALGQRLSAGGTMTPYQAWSEFCHAGRNALWAYSPETVFFAGVLIGIICSLLAGLIILPQNLP